jgi:hypothetical protein
LIQQFHLCYHIKQATKTRTLLTYNTTKMCTHLCQAAKRKNEEAGQGGSPAKVAKTQSHQQFITEWKDSKLTVRLDDMAGTNKKAPPKTILLCLDVQAGKVSPPTSEPAPVSKGWPYWHFDKTASNKVVFENTVMTIQQVVESQSATSVGNLTGVFKDGKCPASLKASTGLKRMYSPTDTDVKAMLTKACMSEYLELLFIVAIRDGIVVPKGLAIVVLKQLVVKKEAIQTMLAFWVPPEMHLTTKNNIVGATTK